jgi:hypothetical protein
LLQHVTKKTHLQQDVAEQAPVLKYVAGQTLTHFLQDVAEQTHLLQHVAEQIHFLKDFTV